MRVVQMTGSDPVVTNWTTEVAGTSRVLQNAPGEDAVPWKAKVGCVWKATFDILNGETSVHREESWFDLRQTRVPGFLLMVCGGGRHLQHCCEFAFWSSELWYNGAK